MGWEGNMQIQIVFIYLFEKQANTDCDSVSLKQQKYLPIKLLEQNILKKKKKISAKNISGSWPMGESQKFSGISTSTLV